MTPLGPRLLSWGRNAPNSLFNWPRSRGAFFVGQVGTARYHIDDAIRIVPSGKPSCRFDRIVPREQRMCRAIRERRRLDLCRWLDHPRLDHRLGGQPGIDPPAAGSCRRITVARPEGTLM